MSELSTNSPVPLYRQLVERIRRDYVLGHNLDTDGPIPSEYELMQRYGVSRITVRNAVSELVKEGCLQKIQGKGTFVMEKKGYPMQGGSGFSASCKKLGLYPSSRVLAMDTVVPPKDEQIYFGLKEGEKLLRVKRLRLGDGQPLVLERLYLPLQYACLTEEDFKGSVFTLLRERFGHVLTMGAKWVEIHHTSKDEAELMGLEEGDALILARECTVDESGKPLHGSRLLITPAFRLFI